LRTVERQTKVRLAVAINDVVERRGLSQEKAAELLGINQPKVSALSKYRLYRGLLGGALDAVLYVSQSGR
jgi:predicted XRE-type DNA-binding protein